MRLIGNVEKDAQVRAVASGALPSGDAVVVNSDGTVSVVAGQDQAIGSAVVFEAGAVTSTSPAFDSNSNKIVIAYQDSGNSNYGTAVVGTVSGTSISFGTPVVFASFFVDYVSAIFDSNSNKIVIAYQDRTSNDRGYAIVGTVSGTSISFGTAQQFESGITYEISATFDSNSNKAVFAYRDESNSNRGTAIVGTVSGTSISFGTAVVFETATTYDIAATFDSNSNKVVIAYEDRGNLNYGTAIVGTVSGTSISFGTAVVFETAQTDWMSATFDSTSNKVVIAYADNGNSSFGTAIVGTVSGTSISFGSPVVFESANTDDIAMTFDSASSSIIIAYQDGGNLNYGTLAVGTVSGNSISFDSPLIFEAATTSNICLAFDSNADKVVIGFQDGGNSSYGTSVVFQAGSTNLTTENFLGFAAHTYADTQSALVNSTCTVDRNQSGLTAGQTYYVQTDGSLGTTAADPSVVAGTAISSTEIIVKG